MRRGAVALLAIAVAACAPADRASRIPAGSGALVGLYKAEFAREGEPSRRARLLLWAAPPDRLHAELLPPVGGSPVTLDAGAGRAVLVDVSEEAAYVGEAGTDAIASLTGVPVGVGDAVSALLDGTTPAGATVVREGEGTGTLPSRFSLSVGPSRIALTRLRWERAARGEEALGTGEPPAGLRVRPLSEWGR